MKAKSALKPALKPALKSALKANHKDLSVPNDIYLRDYFAAKALPFMFEFYLRGDKKFNTQDLSLIAGISYAMADAMLKIRQK